MLKTMITGSLPRPSWLAPAGQISSISLKLEGKSLSEGQDDAVRLAIADQHQAGLDIVTDGEQRRRHYIWGFTEALSGVDFGRMVKKTIRDGRYKTPVDVARVTGPLKRTKSIFLPALEFLKQQTTCPVKVTLPGPMTTADTLSDEYYNAPQALAEQLAELLNEEAKELAENGCDIIQFDEPCFNIYLKEVEDWGIAALEKAGDGIHAKTAVHICYGYGVPQVLPWKNANTEWHHYQHTLPLLNVSTIDIISVECAASPVDPSVLSLAGNKEIMVGVIDVGTEDIETGEQVAQRIREAVQYVDPSRLYPCTDCGMMPLPREIARQKMQALTDGTRIVRTELQRELVTGVPRVGNPNSKDS